MELTKADQECWPGFDTEKITDDQAKCQRCGKVTEFTDAGGRCEVSDGWLCNECISILQTEGEKLTFQDEEGQE